MTPTREAFAHDSLRALADFYQTPDNERRYQEWLKERHGAQTATNETRAAAGECPCGAALAKS